MGESVVAFYKIFSYIGGMANQATDPVSFERNAHWLLLGALGAAFAMAGTITKNERAVFLTEGTALPPKAFAAMVPQQSRDGQVARPARNFFLAPSSAVVPGGQRPARQSSGLVNDLAAPGNAFTPPTAPLTPTGAAPTNTPDTAGPTQLASTAPPQFSPIISQPSAGGGGGPAGGGTTPGGGGTTPGGGGTTPGGGGTTPGGGGTTPGGGGTTPGGDPTPPVSAVPEPGTWAMLLTGFLSIGIALRRRKVMVTHSLS